MQKQHFCTPDQSVFFFLLNFQGKASAPPYTTLHILLQQAKDQENYIMSNNLKDFCECLCKSWEIICIF